MSINHSALPIKKIKTLMIIVKLWMLFLVINLFYLQIILHHNFFVRGQKNFLRIERIACPRGNILDCHGNLLATNRPVINVCWKGTGNRTLTNNQLETLQTLERITGIPLLKSFSNLIIHTEKSATITELISDIQLEQLSQLVELFPNHPNLIIKSHFKRFYPHQSLACHILGYISQINAEIVGKMGLEKIVHENLQGKEGTILKMINSLGTNLEQKEIHSALAGQNIQTTLDLSLQQIAETIFPSNYAGAFMIIDPKTGALKVVLSRPHFDPSLFLDHLSSSQWETMQEGRPFLNRCFYACYPPASIFKLITITAGLELGLINHDSQVYCKGYTKFKGRKYFCSNRKGHGLLDLTKSLAQSCNALFFEKIGMKITIDQLAHYAFKFGLGKKTGILFPEQSGLIPTNAWKMQEKGEPWWPGETLSATIGQSFLLVTPLQIACMISALFEGYFVKPRILESESIERKPFDLSAQIRHFLKKSMKLVVQSGTGIYVSRVSKDIKIYAKTGTAQTTTLKSDDQHIKPEDLHAWFVAYFQYKDQQPLTMVILIEHAGSSQIATTLAKVFLMHYVKLITQKKDTASCIPVSA